MSTEKSSNARKLSRRNFLIGAAVVAGAGVLGAAAGHFLVPEEQAEPSEQEPVEIEAVEPEIVVQTVEVVRGVPTWDAPDLSGREYVIWGLAYDPHIEAYERLADRFEAHTGAHATIEPQAWPIENNIITGMAAGLVPDVCCIMGKQIAPLVWQGAVLATDELVYEMVGCDTGSWFGPVGIQAYTYDGKAWGVPTEGNCVSGVTNVRLDFVAEAGVEELWPPLNGEDGLASFEDMWELAQALQVEDDAGNVTRYGMSSEGWDNRHLFGIMRTLGQPWWDAETRTFGLNTEAAVEAMRLLAYKPIWELGIETHMENGAQELMNAGQVALANGNVTGPSAGRELGLEIDTCLYPSALQGREALYVGEGGWGFIVPSQAKARDIGVEFLKFVTTYEGNREYCRIYGGIVSAVLAVNYDDELFPKGDLVGDAMRRAGKAQERTDYYGSGFGTPSEMEEIVVAAVEAVRVGQAAPEEALAQAQSGLEEMLARWDEAQGA